MSKSNRFSGYFASPLRYPGGKGRLGPWLASVISGSGLNGGWYVEPYAGGAGAALYLLRENHVDSIVINDADPVIYAFWRSVVEDTSDFVDMIRTTPVTLEERARLQEIVIKPDQHSQLELGFAAFFLNRTSRSGILAGGVIGGKEQTGEYKLDARYKKDDLVARVLAIGALRSRITVSAVALAAMKSDIKVGQLIFDVNGEYANANHQDDGSSIAEVFPSTVRYRAVETDGFEDLRTNFYTECAQGLGLIQALFKTERSPSFSGQDLDAFMGTSLEEPDADDRGGHLRWERHVAVFKCILARAGFRQPANLKIKVPRPQALTKQLTAWGNEQEPQVQIPDLHLSVVEAVVGLRSHSRAIRCCSRSCGDVCSRSCCINSQA